MKLYSTPYINSEGERCEVVGWVDLGKLWTDFVKPVVESMAGCDNLDNDLCRAEEIRLLNEAKIVDL